VPTPSRTSDWPAHSAIPTLVPTSVAMGCKPCLQSALGPFNLVPRFRRVFWNTARDGSKPCYTSLLVHSDCVRNDTYRKAFSSSNPRRNVFILSSKLIFLNWHAQLLPSHTLYFAKRPDRTHHYSICLLLSNLTFVLLVDTLYRVYSSVVQITCLHSHHPSRPRSLCFIVNHKAICLLSVVILIYSRLLALNNKNLPVCILLS